MYKLNKIFVLIFALFAADSFAIIYTEEKSVIIVSADHPEFTLKLKSNPTTGYCWLLENYDANFIVPVSHGYEKISNKKMIGAPSDELWTFQVKKSAFLVPTQTKIHLVYVRPWENSGDVKNIDFTVNIGL